MVYFNCDDTFSVVSEKQLVGPSYDVAVGTGSNVTVRSGGGKYYGVVKAAGELLFTSDDTYIMFLCGL